MSSVRDPAVSAAASVSVARAASVNSVAAVSAAAMSAIAAPAARATSTSAVWEPQMPRRAQPKMPGRAPAVSQRGSGTTHVQRRAPERQNVQRRYQRRGPQGAQQAPGGAPGGLRNAVGVPQTNTDKSPCPNRSRMNFEDENMFVCVAIPCSPNHWPLLPRALRSVRLQVRPADFVVIALSHTPPDRCAPLQAEVSQLLPLAKLVCWHNSSQYFTRGANRNVASRVHARRQPQRGITRLRAAHDPCSEHRCRR